MGIKNELLAALKAAGDAVVTVGISEIGPIETASLTALNTLITDLLAKAMTKVAP